MAARPRELAEKFVSLHCNAAPLERRYVDKGHQSGAPVASSMLNSRSVLHPPSKSHRALSRSVILDGQIQITLLDFHLPRRISR